MTIPQIYKYLSDNGVVPEDANPGLFACHGFAGSNQVQIIRWSASLPSKPSEIDLDDEAVAESWYQQRLAQQSEDLSTQLPQRIEDAFTVLVRVINKRLPAEDKITADELKTEYTLVRQGS